MRTRLFFLVEAAIFFTLAVARAQLPNASQQVETLQQRNHARRN
ncbi:MAG: hypothetical protein ACLQSR_11455 [Limisphaerales bacterium]